MNLSIDRKYFAALLVTAPHHDIRYYLNGIHFDGSSEGRMLYVSADGRRMSVYRGSATDSHGTGIIPYDFCVWALRLQKKGILAFTVADGIITHDISGLRSPLIDAKFVDWRKALPVKCSGEVAQFNPDYIQALGKQSTLLLGPRSPIGPIIAHNGNHGALVTFPTEEDFFGVVMPVMTDPIPTSAPQWAINV